MEDRYKILEKILNINGELSTNYFCLKFCDKKIEENYQNYLKDRKLKIFSILSFIIFFFNTFLCIYGITQIDPYLNYLIIMLTFILLDIGITVFYFFTKSNKKLIIEYMKFFIYLTTQILTISFYVSRDLKEYKILRFIFMFILFKNLIFFLILGNSILLFCILFIFVDGFIIFVEINLALDSLFLFEVFVEVIFSIFVFYLKDYFDKLNRFSYLQKFKFKEFFNYSNNLISGIEGYHFTYFNQNLLFTNENLLKHLNIHKNISIKPKHENINKNLENKIINENNKISEIEQESENRNILETEKNKNEEIKKKMNENNKKEKEENLNLNNNNNNVNEENKMENFDNMKYFIDKINYEFNNQTVEKNKSTKTIELNKTNKETVIQPNNQILITEGNEIQASKNKDSDGIIPDSNSKTGINKNSNLQEIEKNLEDFISKLYAYEINNEIINNTINNNLNSNNSNTNLSKLNKERKNSELEKNNNTNLANLNSEAKNKELTLLDKVKILLKNKNEKNLIQENLANNKDNNLNNNIFVENQYKKLGEFYTKDEKEHKFYLGYYRETNDVLDVILQDNTSVKISEKNSIENKLKQKILAKIAHEFKTPLNSIIGLIGQVKDNLKHNIFDNTTAEVITLENSIENKNQKKIKIIKKNKKERENNHSQQIEVEKKEKEFYKKNKITETNKIFKDLILIEYLSNYTIYLINDVVNFISCENTSELQVEKQKVKIKKILKFCFQILKALISCNESKSKNINPQLVIEDKIEFYEINSDEVRLNQILLNFISNAVKFTREGSIIIKSSITTDNFLKISVQDTGIGIKDEDKKFIFSEDKKITNYETNKFGSGLGLSICNIIAKKLDHELEFKSEINFGSIFSVKIKLKENESFIFDLDFSEKSLSRESLLNSNQSKLKSNITSSYSSSNSVSKIFYNSKSINEINFDNSLKKDFSNFDIKNVSKKFSERLKKNKFSLNYEPSKFKKKISKLESFEDETRVINNYDMNFVFNYNPSLKIECDNRINNNNIIQNFYGKKSFKKDKKYSNSNNKNNLNITNPNPSESLNQINIEIFSNDSENLNNSSSCSINLNYNNLEKNFDLNLKNENSFLNSTGGNIKLKKNFSEQNFYNENIQENLIENITKNFNLESLYKKNLNKFSPESIYFSILSNKINNFKKNNNSEHIIRFVIIDDNKYIRNSIKNILEKTIDEKIKNKNFDFAYEILEGQDGVDILKHIIDDQTKNSIKCIFTDENMEYINGSEAIKIIREMENRNKIKKNFFVSITSFDDYQSKAYLEKSGTNIVIQKPISISTMKDIFRKIELNESLI